MPGQYDYSINIPQPPANNFLQSLLGIQQLKGLQQQGELAQQQAAIQQQNAQFAQQMQPLQLEAERARIGQIGQSTAAQAEAFRQGKITFEQAQEDRKRQLDQQAAAQAQQREIVGKFTSLPPNAPMSEIVPIANQLLMLPGGEKVSKQAMENFDALQQEFQKASKTALVTATTQLQAGDINGAKETYGTFEKAVRNSGGNNPQLKQLADGIKAQNMLLDLPNNQGVNSAKLAAVQMLSIIDPKVADSVAGAEEKTWQGSLTKWKAQNAMKGELDPEEVVKRENSLRETFLAQLPVRRFQGRIENYDIIKNAEPTTVGDVAKMTAFIKLGDPDSTVSMAESGQLVASNIGEQAAKLVEKFNINGGKLTPEMRKQIDSQADSSMRSAKATFENGILKGFNETAKRQKLNPENVTGFISSVSIPEKDQRKQIAIDKQAAEEQRVRGMLRPAAGFGNTLTPSAIQPQGSAVGIPTDVDSILKKFGVN